MGKYVILLVASLLFTSAPVSAQPENKMVAEAKVKMDAAFRDTAIKLSPSGEKRLKEMQEDWLLFLDEYCAMQSFEWRETTVEDCFLDHYASRAKELKNAVTETKQGLTFRREEHVAARVVDLSADPPISGMTKYRIELSHAWPQIDDPRNDHQRAWNKFMSDSRPKSRDTGCDEQSKYAIGLTGTDFISVETVKSSSCAGAAHGFWNNENFNRVLSENRAMTAADVFKPDVDWKSAVTALALKSFDEQKKSEVRGIEKTQKYMTDKMRIYTDDPQYWHLTPEGLEVNYGILLGYVQGEYKAKLSWQDLNPYLAETSPVIDAVHAAMVDQAEVDNFISAFIQSHISEEKGAQVGAEFRGREIADLNRDGKEEIVLLWMTLQGSSGNNHLTIFTKENGKYKEVASIKPLGHASLSTVKKGIIRIDQRVLGLGDPRCCPTVEKYTVYKWDGDKIMETRQ